MSDGERSLASADETADHPIQAAPGRRNPCSEYAFSAEFIRGDANVEGKRMLVHPCISLRTRFAVRPPSGDSTASWWGGQVSPRPSSIRNTDQRYRASAALPLRSN